MLPVMPPDRNAAAATPPLHQPPPLSARNLAASLWHHMACGGTVITWQCRLPFHRLGFEGATKWDYANHLQSNVRLITSAAFAGQAELVKSRKQVKEVETDGGRSRRKIKHRTRKNNEERGSIMTTEQQVMMRSVIKNLAKNVKNERKICKNIEKINSNLLRDIAEAKLSARKFVLNLERERKAREELDYVSYDLAKEIEARKAEIGALRNRQKRIQLEVEEERKMLQLAEVWREEQLQMKLADAKFILEDKYTEMKDLIAHLRALFRGLNSPAGVNNETSKVEMLRHAFGHLNNQSGKDFKLLNHESDSAFAFTETSRTSEAETRHDEAHCPSSVTETRGHDQSRSTHMSNCNADQSERKVPQKSEGSEICSISLMQPKPRSEGISCKAMSSSNRSMSASRDGRNPHVVRAMKGHIAWPWRIGTDEAKLENQKMLVRKCVQGQDLKV